MFSRDKQSRITVHCDTRPCKATLDTGRKSLTGASNFARSEGWAIGNDLDACRDHHA